MNEKWKELYESLCDHTTHISRSGPPGATQTENLFKTCIDYWSQCKTLVQTEGFHDDMEEIRFFKYVKPRFTGQLEYYMLVYQHQLFSPIGDAAETAAFNDNERRRITRFRAQYNDFIRYYMEGQTAEDAALFLRRHCPAEPIPYVRIFDRDPELRTAADWKAALLAGHAWYETFLSTAAVVPANLSGPANPFPLANPFLPL